MTMRSKFLRALVLAIAGASLLAACGGGDDDDLDDRADLADPKVRFVHVVPNGPDVTLQRDGKAESDATDVGYLFASQYYDIGQGNTKFTLVTGPVDTELASETFDVMRGDKYTLLALPAGAGADLVKIEDPYNKSVASDNARVRFVNASFNTDELDLYLNEPGVDLEDVDPTIASVDYKAFKPASGKDSIELEGGDYRLRITEAGDKSVIFSANVTVPKDGDWLLLTVPIDDATPGRNNIRVLLVRSDDSDDATEIINSD